MKWNLFYPGITALLLLNHPAAAAQHNWFLTLGAGAQFPAQHAPMRIDNGSEFPSPYNHDRYSISKSNGAVIAMSAGRHWQNDSDWFSAYSLGISWQYLFNAPLKGKISQYSLSQYTNYTYNLDFSANLLLISGKLNLFKRGMFSPYINGGIGSSFNKVSNYNETALADVTPRVSPGFRTANTSEFAYQIGAGIDVHYSPRFILSLGYVYQDLGPYPSGNGVDSWSNQALNPGPYHSNEILASITYLF